MLNEKKVSVIVPIYNVELYLRKCVESILHQTYTNLEIILVDDGSPDHCGEICDAYEQMDDRITVIHKENAGLGPARNSGLAIASGEYVSFIDSDDYIVETMYESMVESMNRYGCDIVTAGRYNLMEDGTMEEVFTLPQPLYMTKDEALKRLLTYDHMDSAAWDKLYKRELFDGEAYPQGYISEDVAVTYRLFDKAVNGICHCGVPVYYYLQRSKSLSKSKFSEKTRGAEIYSHQVMDYIKEKYPSLEKEGEYFYLFQLPLLMDILSVSEGSNVYKNEIVRIMRNRLGKALRNPYMSKRQIIKYLLTALNIYPIIRRLYVKRNADKNVYQ